MKIGYTRTMVGGATTPLIDHVECVRPRGLPQRENSQLHHQCFEDQIVFFDFLSRLVDYEPQKLVTAEVRS